MQGADFIGKKQGDTSNEQDYDGSVDGALEGDGFIERRGEVGGTGE